MQSSIAPTRQLQFPIAQGTLVIDPTSIIFRKSAASINGCAALRRLSIPPTQAALSSDVLTKGLSPKEVVFHTLVGTWASQLTPS